VLDARHLIARCAVVLRQLGLDHDWRIEFAWDVNVADEFGPLGGDQAQHARGIKSDQLPAFAVSLRVRAPDLPTT
jgi:hypothetical protein